MKRGYGIAAAVGLSVAALAASMLDLAQAGDPNGRALIDLDRSRILSIGGDVTEILYAIAAADRIVAVDATSQYPVSALSEKKRPLEIAGA